MNSHLQNLRCRIRHALSADPQPRTSRTTSTHRHTGPPHGTPLIGVYPAPETKDRDEIVLPTPLRMPPIFPPLETETADTRIPLPLQKRNDALAPTETKKQYGMPPIPPHGTTRIGVYPTTKSRDHDATVVTATPTWTRPMIESMVGKYPENERPCIIGHFCGDTNVMSSLTGRSCLLELRPSLPEPLHPSP